MFSGPLNSDICMMVLQADLLFYILSLLLLSFSPPHPSSLLAFLPPSLPPSLCLSLFFFFQQKELLGPLIDSPNAYNSQIQEFSLGLLLGGKDSSARPSPAASQVIHEQEAGI